MTSDGAASVRDRYTGKVAREYEARRKDKPVWKAEWGAVYNMTHHHHPGATLLDVPVGTGRFAEIYEMHQFQVWGLDTSKDMIVHAIPRVNPMVSFGLLYLDEGSILSMPYPDGYFDCVVCVRLLNWFNEDEMFKAIAEIGRVTKEDAVISIRFSGRTSKKGNRPHSQDAFTEALARSGLGENQKARIFLAKPDYFMAWARHG